MFAAINFDHVQPYQQVYLLFILFPQLFLSIQIRVYHFGSIMYSVMQSDRNSLKTDTFRGSNLIFNTLTHPYSCLAKLFISWELRELKVHGKVSVIELFRSDCMFPLLFSVSFSLSLVWCQHPKECIISYLILVHVHLSCKFSVLEGKTHMVNTSGRIQDFSGRGRAEL